MTEERGEGGERGPQVSRAWIRNGRAISVANGPRNMFLKQNKELDPRAS
jgi:hypothetical protein